jgi:small subunit ribosomal protein S16
MPRLPRTAFVCLPPVRQFWSFTMVKIRLSRGGAKGRPFYHVVVTDQRSKRDGRNIENVGYYNPVASGKDKRLELNVDRVKEWVGKGAQLTDKVAALVKEAGKQQAAA